MIRVAHTSGALAHLFESEFLEQKYAELTKTLDPRPASAWPGTLPITCSTNSPPSP